MSVVQAHLLRRVDELCHGHVLLNPALANLATVSGCLSSAFCLTSELPAEAHESEVNTMAGHFDDAWHNMQGQGLAYRPPPTANEAIPYSPFTSIIPFALGRCSTFTRGIATAGSLTCYRVRADSKQTSYRFPQPNLPRRPPPSPKSNSKLRGGLLAS